jgi:hypothetical protein
MPVPFALCGSGITATVASAYNERAAASQSVLSTTDLFEMFIHAAQC